MEPDLGTFSLRQIPVLLRGEVDSIGRWLDKPDARRAALYVAVILAGAGLYGAAVGLWRSPLQAGYNAIKFPLIVLLTTLTNALINGMFAPLLGLDLRFRQSLLAVLMSFTIAAAILGSFSPVVLFMVWNTPPLGTDSAVAAGAHSFLLVSQVTLVAFAGVAGNLRLWQLLRQAGGSDNVASQIMLAWLASNLFLGGQISWMLRPFIGAPHLPVEFLRDDVFAGSFYEILFVAVGRLFLE
ncbi:MAG: hypothetical protein HZA91_11740 [Verrucomicrobia bacterium]|nr:hypothetical protein [Verrucomicrobiota bacterium]